MAMQPGNWSNSHSFSSTDGLTSAPAAEDESDDVSRCSSSWSFEGGVTREAPDPDPQQQQQQKQKQQKQQQQQQKLKRKSPPQQLVEIEDEASGSSVGGCLAACAADCTALCCCPLTVFYILGLVCIKFPSTIARKTMAAIRRRRQRRKHLLDEDGGAEDASSSGRGSSASATATTAAASATATSSPQFLLTSLPSRKEGRMLSMRGGGFGDRHVWSHFDSFSSRSEE